MDSSRNKFGDTTLTKVFVGGLAWETPKDTLRQHFQTYGQILEAVIIFDKLTGRSKGYGFVTFKEAEAAKKACEEPSLMINGRLANCNIASLGARRPRSNSPTTTPPPPPPPPYTQQGTKKNSSSHVQWYYPVYGYSTPTYIATDHMNYNFNYNYNQKVRYGGFVYPPRQAIVGANALMPVVYPLYRTTETVGIPAAAAAAASSQIFHPTPHYYYSPSIINPTTGAGPVGIGGECFKRVVV